MRRFHYDITYTRDGLFTHRRGSVVADDDKAARAFAFDGIEPEPSDTFLVVKVDEMVAGKWVTVQRMGVSR